MAGHAFRLRPIELADAPLIISLRSDADRTRYLHGVPLDVAAQEEYLSNYFSRPGDYYFVIQRLPAGGGGAEGLIGIYSTSTPSFDAARGDAGSSNPARVLQSRARGSYTGSDSSDCRSIRCTPTRSWRTPLCCPSMTEPA